MKRVIGALLCAVTVSGCATTYDVEPLADGSEAVRYDQGIATSYFETNDLAMQVTPLNFNAQNQITFGVAVVNKSDHPINFGYENLALADAAGKPIAMYDRGTLERQARNRAMVASALVGIAGAAAAYGAASSAYSTTNATLYTPRGAYTYSSRTYDPGLAYASTAVATAATGAGLVSIQQQLSQTIAGIKGRILATTTIDPGKSYGGTIVGDRLKGGYPQVVTLRVSENGVSHEFRFKVAAVQ